MTWQVNLVSDYGAIGDGAHATEDSQAFVDFKTDVFARPDLDELVELTIPPEDYLLNSTASRLFCDFPGGQGIKKLKVIMTGATFASSDGSIYFFGGEGVTATGNVAASGGRIYDANAGAQQVTLLDADDATKFVVGGWACVMGLDMQGLLGADYGFPPNPAFHDYVKVTDITGGVISFDEQLDYAYKAHWPQIGADPGAAHIVPLSPSWGCEHHYLGGTFTQGGGNVGSKSEGRKITWENPTFTGNHGITGTQNGEIHLINYTGTSNLLECDKMIDLVNVVGGTISAFQFQSSSIKRVRMNGADVGLFDGTGRDCELTDMVIPTFRPGVTGYGYAERFKAINCELGDGEDSPPSFAMSGVTTSGNSDFYDIQGGTIIIPVGGVVQGVSANGSGKLRVELTSTEGLITGKKLRLQGLSGLEALSIGALQEGGDYVCTVFDGTHVDFAAITLGANVWTGGGFCYNVNPYRAVVPGAYFTLTCDDGNAPGGQILDTEEVDGQYLVYTTLPDDMDAWPDLEGSIVNFGLINNARWTIDADTTVPLYAGLQGAPANRPLASWWRENYGSNLWPWNADPALPLPFVFGYIRRITIEVLQAMEGSSVLFEVVSNGVFYDAGYNRYSGVVWEIDPTIEHTVVITPGDVSGMQGNDDITLPTMDALWYTKANASPHYASSPTGMTQQPIIRVTYDMDQGPPIGRSFTCNFVAA